MEELIDNLKEQIIDQLNLEDMTKEDIDADDPLFGDGLGLDSIDALELIVLLEKHYGIKIEDPKEGQKIFLSVRSIAEFIQENQKRINLSSKKVYVTGIGAVSAIGNNASENLNSLLNLRHGIGPVSLFPTRHNLMVGEVKQSNESIISSLNLDPKGAYTRTTLLGLLAAKEAYDHAGLKQDSEFKTGIISSTSVGGMNETEKYYYEYLESDEHLDLVDTHDCGDSTEDIADYLGIKDYLGTISTACSSAANAIMMGARLIKAGKVDRMLVGGTDCLSKFTLNGFNTLMILDAEHSRPFDQTRKGLNLGEGAGFIVLESEEAVKKEGKNVLAELSGYGNANDAHHQTASSPEGKGAFLAMQAAFSVSGLNPGDIDYINVHGTGTENNDQSEGTAIQRLFGESIPPFSSIKAFTGHTLAAAGGLEAVYSVQAIQNGCVYPNLNFKNPIETLSMVPESEAKQGLSIQHVLSNSFGFGGNCSSLIFSKA